jgi:hypothetical protein
MTPLLCFAQRTDLRAVQGTAANWLTIPKRGHKLSLFQEKRKEMTEQTEITEATEKDERQQLFRQFRYFRLFRFSHFLCPAKSSNCDRTQSIPRANYHRPLTIRPGETYGNEETQNQTRTAAASR